MIKFSVWVSPNTNPRTKISLDVAVDGADSKLLEDTSNGRSVATYPNEGFLFLTYLAAYRSTCCLLCPFVYLLVGHITNLEISSLIVLSFMFHSDTL